MLPEFHPDPAYAAPAPTDARPIVIIGAGGIVTDAHLPAYRRAGYPVAAIVNRTRPEAEKLATEYGIPMVHTDLGEAVRTAPDDAVFDLALMPEQYLAALSALPDGSAVLIQKPLGNDLRASEAVVELCQDKGLVAAANTQLRFAPYVAAARRLIADGAIGELIDFEVRVAVNTPWHLFPNVMDLPRLEINAHSMHYIDLVRSFLGDPTRVLAVTVPRPGAPVANTRTQLILRYGDRPLRVTIGVDHDHVYGPDHEESFIKWEGTRGAVRAQMGLLLDYPSGGPDRLQWVQRPARPDQVPRWRDVAFTGSWFPDAFIGSMGALQNFVLGHTETLPTSVQQVLGTSRVVEQAYASSAGGP